MSEVAAPNAFEHGPVDRSIASLSDVPTSDVPTSDVPTSDVPTSDVHEQNKLYWQQRHSDMRGDIRAVGHKGKSIEENLAGYDEKARRLAQVLVQEGALAAGDGVLDLGCGTARLGPMLVSLGFAYTGIDVSPVALEQARTICPEGTFVECDLLSFEPRSEYAVVLVTDVLCHLVSETAWKEAIALIHRALARDGLAIIIDNIGDSLVAYKDYVLQRPWDAYGAAFGEAGLTIARTAANANSFLVRHAKPAEAEPATGLSQAAVDTVQDTGASCREDGVVPTRAPIGAIRPRPATTPDEVAAVVAGYPHSPHERGVVLYDFIRKHSLTRVLELGFNHGVSTCYAAAALASLGSGHIVTIDRQQAAAYDPGLEQFLASLGLSDYVTPFYEASSYNWRLRDFLNRRPAPVFDLVFLDGGHLFEPDALAFLLAEKLVRPGGYFIFDDINWSMASSPTSSPDPLKFGPEEIDAQQVREVIDLLVRPHPDIAEWWEDHKWGFARKKTEQELGLAVRQRDSLAEDACQSRRRALENFPHPILVEPGLKPGDWQQAINRGLHANAQSRATPR